MKAKYNKRLRKWFFVAYRAPEVCRETLFALYMVPESPPGLLQCGFVSRLPQLPQNQTSQQDLQVTCRTDAS